MSIDKIKFTFTGISALMMCRDTLVDVLHPLTIAHKKLTSIKGKNRTEKVEAQLQRSGWEAMLYWDEKLGPYVPMEAIRKCIEAGARRTKNGAMIREATFFDVDMVALKYKGPRDRDGMYDAGYLDRRSVVQGQSRVMKTRPKFAAPWSLTFDLALDPDAAKRDEVVAAAETAGKYCGLLDMRPALGGSYGRFMVEAK